MRSIKFRAFINGEMIYDLAYEEYAPINDLLEGTDNLMQFTGLFDKQGVEIYEYMEIDDNFEVSFKDSCYILTNISNGDIILLYNYWSDKNGQIEITKEYTKV